MTDLAFTICRLAFLALLWLMVFAVVATLRKDMYGTVMSSRGKNAAETKRASPPPVRAQSTQPEFRNLLVTGGSLTGTILPLHPGQITIGRSPSSTLVLDDRFASTNHATLSRQGDKWILTDMGSTNGTFVDEERISVPVRIRPGNTVRIGQTTFELVN